MLLTQLNALFIHIPKTGGNSVQNVLAPYADDRKVLVGAWQDGMERFELRNDRLPTTKHSALSEYRKHLDAGEFDGLFKFTVLRNTFDRVMSFYFSPHRGEIHWDRAEFKEFVKTVKPIVHYLGFPGQSLREAADNIDRYLRFESLETEVPELLSRLGISGSLGRYNQTSQTSKLTFYDQDLVDYVGNLFEEEISYFEFSPPI